MAARKFGGNLAEPEETTQSRGAAASKGFEHAASAMQDGMSGAVAGFEKTQAEVKANMEKAMRTAEEFLSFGQGNVEAVMRSGRIWAEGVQDLGKSFAATAQAQFDQTMSTFKAMAGVKSLKEAIDLQTNLARSSVETAVNGNQPHHRCVDEAGRAGDGADHAAREQAVEKFGRNA